MFKLPNPVCARQKARFRTRERKAPTFKVCSQVLTANTESVQQTYLINRNKEGTSLFWWGERIGGCRSSAVKKASNCCIVKFNAGRRR
jgi:hypothetical protein